MKYIYESVLTLDNSIISANFEIKYMINAYSAVLSGKNNDSYIKNQIHDHQFTSKAEIISHKLWLIISQKATL